MTNLILMLVEQGCGRLKRVERVLPMSALASIPKSDRGKCLEAEVAMLEAKLNASPGTCQAQPSKEPESEP